MKTVPISKPRWMITRENVEIGIQELDAKHKPGDILVIQWLDNSIFFVLDGETGSVELPKRDEQDGLFHITGRVTVSKDMQLETLLDKLERLLARMC